MSGKKLSLGTKRLLWAGCLIGCLAVAVVLYLFDPSRVPVYPVCTFHRVTGLDCPGCGSLRAMHQLLHGNFIAALQFNALTVVSALLLPLAGLWLAWNHFRGRRPLSVRPVWLWIYLGVWVAFGILRLLPVPLFASTGS